MKEGDLVVVRPRFSDWDCGVGIYLGKDKDAKLCKVLFDDKIFIFHRHELKRYESR